MEIMNLVALALAMSSIGIFVEVIRGLNKIERETMARVRECDFPFENQCKEKAE